MIKSDFGLLTSESVAIPLRGVHVEGVITGRAAKVKVRQHFTNSDTNPMEAIYKFPLPENSAVCGFRAAIGESTWEGEIEEREKAFKTYDEALARGDGAYLLDEERPNIFTLSLGNLNPKTSAVVEIDYVMMLDTHGQAVRFFLPTTISPRYVPDGMEKADIPVEDIVNPVYAESVPYGLRINLDVHGAEGVSSIGSSSHSIITKFGEGLVQVEFSAETVAMDRDFVLDIEYKDEFQNRAFRFTDGNTHYLQLDFSPVLKAPTGEHDGDAEIIFVLDCSGSMMGSSIEQAKQALTIFLRGMDRSMHFNVYRFGSTFRKLFKTCRPYTQDALTEAVDYLSKVDADLGGTELLAPLREIYATEAREHSSRRIILITDGEIGNELDVSRLVKDNAQTTSLFVVGIGYAPNEYLIKQLGRSSGGAAECIAPGDRIEPMVLRLFKKVIGGRICNPTVDWGAEVDQAPSSPAIYNEQALSLFGKAQEDMGKLNRIAVVGDYLGSRQEWQIDVRPVTGADIPVSLLWAREKIRDLEEGTAIVVGSKQVARKKTDVTEMIIALSREHGVIARATSFIAVEKRPDSQRTTGDTVLRKIPVMMTKDWHGGVGGLTRGIDRSVIQSQPRFDSLGHRREHHAKALFRRPQALDSGVASREYAPTARRPQEDPLLAVLALQRAEGGFELDETVAQMIGLSCVKLKECATRMQGQGRFDKWILLSTVIVLRTLETTFAGDQSIWFVITRKSRQWYEAEESRVKPSIDGMALSDWADDYIASNRA